MTLTFTCDECGTEFPPDPDCMVETFLSAENDGHEGHPMSMSPADREEAKREMQVTDGELDHMLAGSTVTVGACVRKPCQNRMENES